MLMLRFLFLLGPPVPVLFLLLFFAHQSARQEDFLHMQHEKEAGNKPLTVQEEVLLMNLREMFPRLATTKDIFLRLRLPSSSSSLGPLPSA